MTDIRQKIINHFDDTYWGNIDGGADFGDMADEIIDLIAEGAEQRLADGPFAGQTSGGSFFDPDGNELPLSEIVSAILPIQKKSAKWRFVNGSKTLARRCRSTWRSFPYVLSEIVCRNRSSSSKRWLITTASLNERRRARND